MSAEQTLHDLLERNEGRAGIIFTTKLRAAIRAIRALEYNNGQRNKASELAQTDRRKGVLAHEPIELERRYT